MIIIIVIINTYVFRGHDNACVKILWFMLQQLQWN